MHPNGCESSLICTFCPHDSCVSHLLECVINLYRSKFVLILFSLKNYDRVYWFTQRAQQMFHEPQKKWSFWCFAVSKSMNTLDSCTINLPLTDITHNMHSRTLACKELVRPLETFRASISHFCMKRGRAGVWSVGNLDYLLTRTCYLENSRQCTVRHLWHSQTPRMPLASASEVCCSAGAHKNSLCITGATTLPPESRPPSKKKQNQTNSF